MLDFFTYNTAGARAGIVNLNTRNGPVLASIIRGAWLHDPGAEILPPDRATVSSFPRRRPRRRASHCSRDHERHRGRGPALTRADVARLAAAAAAAVPRSRSLGRNKADDRARVGGGRPSANLEPDDRRNRANGTIHSGTRRSYRPSKFIVQGEKRYWLHIALDRDDGTVLGTQLEEVVE